MGSTLSLSRRGFGRLGAFCVAVFALAIDVRTPSAAQDLRYSDQQGSLYGQSVASAGDVNGDGFDDVIVGAPYYDRTGADSGAAFLYLGSAAGVSQTYRCFFVGLRAGAHLGESVSTAGDVNGDGFDDVLIGAPDDGDRFEGATYLFLGSSSGLSTSPAWTFKGISGLEHLGKSVASAGDVNKDGFSDVIVGSYGYSNGQLSEGRALVFLGSASGLSTQPNWEYETNSEGALFGYSVASAGDVNGDGYGDIIVGALQERSPTTVSGRAYVFIGGGAGISQQPTWVYGDTQNAGQVGVSVASAGDVNRDGFGDVIVGQHAYGRFRINAGRAFLFLGSKSGLSWTPAWTSESNSGEGLYGASVASAGDVNGDGFSDVIVGSRLFKEQGQMRGGVFLFLGTSQGLASLPDWTYFGRQNIEGFGASAAPAGDINGDSLSDVVVGATNNSDVVPAGGAAYLFLGSSRSSLQVSPSPGTCPIGGATYTPTATPSQTPTHTQTPTVTTTQLPTVSATPTATPSLTPTSTLTPTVTPTTTAAATLALIATPPMTPTSTATETATRTPTPIVTRTATPTATPSRTYTSTPTATPTSTNAQSGRVTPTVTPTNTPTGTQTPTSNSTATPNFTITPAVSSDVVCAQSIKAAEGEAFANSAMAGCAARNAAQFKGRWALKTVALTGQASTSCPAGAGVAQITSFDLNAKAVATGDTCGWKYSPTLAASWRNGGKPTVSVVGINDRCAKVLPGGVTRRLSVRVAPGGKTARVDGQMRARLADCSGWHPWTPFQMTVTAR